MTNIDLAVFPEGPSVIKFECCILLQNKTQELGCLCFLKDVDFDPLDLENAVIDLR